MGTTTTEQIIYDWSKTAFGNAVLLTEQAEINKILPKLLGDYLVKIGGPNQNTFLQRSPVKKKNIPHQ